MWKLDMGMDNDLCFIMKRKWSKHNAEHWWAILHATQVIRGSCTTMVKLKLVLGWIWSKMSKIENELKAMLFGGNNRRQSDETFPQIQGPNPVHGLRCGNASCLWWYFNQPNAIKPVKVYFQNSDMHWKSISNEINSIQQRENWNGHFICPSSFEHIVI